MTRALWGPPSRPAGRGIATVLGLAMGFLGAPVLSAAPRIDDVSLDGRPAQVPDRPAARFDFKQGQGETVRGVGGAAAMDFFGRREVPLVQGGRPAFTLVYGREDAAAARRLRDALALLLGASPPIAEAGEVLEPGTWRLADRWLDKNLVLLGNIHTNRAILPLYSALLAGTSARYPGPGSYEIRTLFAPLHRGADLILVGGSDRAGVDAAVSRFLHLVGRLAAEKPPGGMPPFFELGGPAGPDALSQEPVYGEFCNRVSRFFWHGNLVAARSACESLLAQLKSQPRGLWRFREANHYESARNYCALRQLLAAGALSDQDRARVDERLLQNALENTDRYQVRAMTADSQQVSRGLDRHLLSSVLGQFVLLEYLDRIAAVPVEKREEVRRRHLQLRSHIEAFIRQGRFRADREGKEGLDCVSALADLYLRAGDERLIRGGVLRNMADYYVANVDNLGCQAGQDSYITAMPGEQYSGTSGGLGLLAAAYFHRDGQYRWLRENLKGFACYWGTRFRLEYAPETLSLPEQVPPAYPARYVGLSIVPIEPWDYEAMQAAAASESMRPLQAPRESVFSKAVFRDGCGPQDAYLMLQGINPGGADGYQGNALVRFTELGSLLLFQNSERQSSWARSVVSTSRGGHDPQAPACVLETRFSSPVVSAISSLFPHDGGAAWRRSVVRRHGGYFAVLDEVTAQAEDTYQLTCRWRSFHPGETDGSRSFSAVDGMNGTVLRVVASEPVAQTLRHEQRDGATEPTIWRQHKTAQLGPGQSETFQNLLYATNEQVGRAFDIRRLSDRAALVRGGCKAFQELAAIGTGRIEPPEAAGGEARLWYLSPHALAVAGARSLALPGRARMAAAGDVNLLLFCQGQPSSILNPGPHPVELSVACQPGTAVTLDDRALGAEDRVSLEPGEHPLSISGLADFFAHAATELRQAWAGREASRPAPAAGLASRDANPWREVWRYEGIVPPPARHLTIKATAEPATTVGTPAAWVDRVIHYRSEPSAGWDAGTEGTAVLDLHREVPLDAVRLIGRMDAFREAPISFRVELSSDGFRQDVRRLDFPAPPLQTHYAEMATYMSTYRFPMYVLPLGQRARCLRIRGRSREHKEAVVFHEIQVLLQQRQPATKVNLFTADFLGNGRPAVLAASGRQLVTLAPDGTRLWQQELESPFVSVNVADVNSDGKQDVIAFTLAEKMHVYNGDGWPRFVHDVRQGDIRSKSPWRPAFVGAWRPDARGNLEYYFLPHVRYGRVSPEPERKQFITESQGDRGGKYAFPVPDVTGDGREELAIVGRYGMGFGVLDSGSDLAAGKLRYLADRPLTGHSSPNMQLPMYFDGSVVRSATPPHCWMGVVALNPGGINYYSAPDFKPVWAHFTHAPIACHCLYDMDGDGTPDLLVGREDGYVIQYSIADGSVMKRAFVGGEVRAIAAAGGSVAVGTSNGLMLLDRQLRRAGMARVAVQAVRVLEMPAPQPPLLAVALDNGTIAGMRPAGDR